MRSFSPQSLIYSPFCSWVAEMEQVYFNGDTFSQGQYFKAMIIAPDDSRRFKLSIQGEDEEEPKQFDFNLIDYIQPKSCLFSLSLDTSEVLKPGSYLAQVYSNELEDDGGNVIGERCFHVLSPKEFHEHWRGLFGETWDEPVFWDALESEQMEELLEGLPVDKLFEVFPEGIKLDGNILYDLIGPITTALVANEIGGSLPCVVDHNSNERPSSLPHIDLTKLFWLLNAVAPVLADKIFFSYRARVDVWASEEHFSLIVKTDNRQKDERSSDPPLITLIDRITGGIRFDISDDRFEMIIDADRF